MRRAKTFAIEMPLVSWLVAHCKAKKIQQSTLINNLILDYMRGVEKVSDSVTAVERYGSGLYKMYSLYNSGSTAGRFMKDGVSDAQKEIIASVTGETMDQVTEFIENNQEAIILDLLIRDRVISHHGAEFILNHGSAA